MNTIKPGLASNTNIIYKKTVKKSPDSGKKISDSFNASEAAPDNPTYGPNSIKNGEVTEMKMSDRLLGVGKETLKGIGLGLAAGAAMTVVAGAFGTLFFGATDFLMDILMVPHGPGPGMDALVTLGKTAMIGMPALFGTLGAIGGFLGMGSDGKKETPPEKTPAPSPAPA